MLSYEASDTIDAPPEVVWEVLIQVSKWPEFDPYCEKIEGEVAMGNKLKAYTKLQPGRAFPVIVTRLDENRAMTWQGGMPFGLFRGVRTYELEPAGEAQTRFEMREEFSGPLLGLFGKSIPDMTEPFAKFVAGLKRTAESK